MKTFKVYLDEMAVNIGDHSWSELSQPSYRSKMYDLTKNNHTIKTLESGAKLHKHIDKNKTKYTTNDHDNKETLHYSRIEHNDSTKDFPYEHDEQTQVDRVKDSSKIPKGHATDVTYDHFKQSKYPLRTSDTQFRKGHEMWHRLVDKALDDGHHVYHWDGKSLHKTTQENKKDHLSDSFGQGDNYQHKHMILSKTPL